jgi:hypothetical protein
MFEASVSKMSQETSYFLHTNKQNEVVNANRFTTNNSSSATKVSMSAEENTYHALKGKSRNHVL